MPIPDNYNIPVSEATEYELLPEDTYQVQITKLDLKTDQTIYQSTEVEDKFAFEFTIVEEGEYKGRKLWLDVRTIMSAGWTGGSPSWLYKIFCAVNAIQLTDEEAKSVTAKNVNEMLGKQLRLIVKQKPNQKGIIKNKIVDVMALKGAAIGWEEPVVDHSSIEEEDINVDDIPF